MYKLKHNIVKINERRKGPTVPWKIWVVAVKLLFTLFAACCDGQDTQPFGIVLKLCKCSLVYCVYMVWSGMVIAKCGQTKEKSNMLKHMDTEFWLFFVWRRFPSDIIYLFPTNFFKNSDALHCNDHSGERRTSNAK